MRAPSRVHLPSGRACALALRPGLTPRGRRRGAPLFSEMIDLVESGELRLGGEAEAVDIQSLELRDFHTLRAIATRLGCLVEEPVEIRCCNCDAPIRHAPCAAIALGPFVDAELDDPELDRTLDLSVAHSVPTIELSGGVHAVDVKLGPITVATAAPLHRALRRRRVTVTDRVVRGMGVEALGPESHPDRIAEALSHCSDEAFGAIGDLFLSAHYAPRLSSIAVCPRCGARNDVDAPYEREFEPTGSGHASNQQVFADFGEFDARAREAYERIAGRRARDVRFVVEAGVPACDDGGTPLLGAYLPPGGDRTAPVGAAEVTVYYRAFRAEWDEGGPYDWAAELDETIEHELSHHDGWLVGHDPMDDEERAAIARDRARTQGRRVIAREDLRALGADLGGFVARTWPVWLFVAAVTVAMTVCDH